MATVNVKPHQCLLDLSMQEKGSIAALFEFAVLNNYSITDDLVAGSTLQVPDSKILDMEIWQALNRAAIIPANGYTAADEMVIKGGIDYMGVQIDFRVS